MGWPDYVSESTPFPANPWPNYVSESTSHPANPWPDYVSESTSFPANPWPDYVSESTPFPANPWPDYVSESPSDPANPWPDYVSESPDCDHCTTDKEGITSRVDKPSHLQVDLKFSGSLKADLANPSLSDLVRVLPDAVQPQVSWGQEHPDWSQEPLP